MQSTVLAEPTLVGREQEFAQLQHYLELALEGKGATVFVSGEAGAGKTRLTAEFLSRARNQGITTLTGWCLSNAAIPYFPFFEAFNAYFSGKENEENESAGDVTAWLKGPTQGEQLGKPAFTPQSWKDQTFAAVTKTLLSISSRKPVVLFIDDLHWADSASLALINYIARAARSERILLLATFRSEELRADSEGRPHPLVETLRLMRREDLVEEIKVTILSQESVSELATNMLGGELQQELAEKLAKESQGNPLFIVESLRMLYERKGLLQEDKKWRLAHEDLAIPEKIKDIILQRLNCLLRNQRRLIEASSAIGEKFTAELLASVLSLDSAEVVETLDVIGQTTSLVRCDGVLYRFDHARTRDAIYEEISPALKRVYHAKIAEKLESRTGESLFSELAYHYSAAGNDEKAIEYALVAGRDALARWSNSEAIKQFTYVLKAVGADFERVEKKLVALEGLGDAFYASNMFKEATKIFEDVANSSLTDSARLRAYRKAMEAVFQYGDMPNLMDLVKKAEAYATADRLENARIIGSRARILAMTGKDPSEALDAWEEALNIFEEEYSLWDVAWVLIGSGALHTRVLLPRNQKVGFAELLRSVTMFEELVDFRWLMEACFIAGEVFSMSLLQEGRGLLAKVVEIEKRENMGDYQRLVYANSSLARSFWEPGCFETALTYSLKALEFSKKTDSAVAHGMVYSDLTVEYALLGDTKHSEEYFEKLMKLPPQIVTHVFVQAQLAKPVFFAAKNQWKESNQAFENSIEHFNQLSLPVFDGVMSKVKLLYAWALEKQGCSKQAEILHAEVQNIYREVDAKFAHADVQANLMVRSRVVVGEEFEMRIDLVNVGRKPASLVEIKNALPDDVEITSSSLWCNIQKGTIEIINKEIGAFQVNAAKLTLKSLSAGTYKLNPQVVYVDDLGETKTCNLRPVFITASLPTPKERVAGKISSGNPSLDRLLIGGIPENYAVALAAPSSDERSLLIKCFLEEGVEAGETTFYLTVEAGTIKTLAEKYPSNFYLFLCNPQADAMIQNLPNVYKLKGLENLTEIDIALTKAIRSMNPSAKGAKRICLEIVSDVLLQHQVINTRRWLIALLPTLKSKSFTILALIDPQMHTTEELQAVLSVFEGEIRVREKETPEGTKQILKIRKLINQRYLDKEIILSKERVSD